MEVGTISSNRMATDAAKPTAATALVRPSASRPTCRHCGATLIDERMRDSGFCCAGCSYVYRLVHEHGLAGYYRVKDPITAPADAVVFAPRDYAWITQAQQQAEAENTPVPEMSLGIQGISCAGCVWLIERLFQQRPGARDITVNAAYGTLRLRWVRGQFSAAEFAGVLQQFGYLVGPAGKTAAEPESRALVRRIGLCAAFAMNAMLFSLPTYFGMDRTFEWAGLFRLLGFVFGTLSFLVGGSYFLQRAFLALRERVMHIDLPIAIGIVGAYLGSTYGWLAGEARFVYFDFVATFILLMLVGRWAQTAAVERNRRRLLAIQPQAQRVRCARGIDLAPEEIKAGEHLSLGAGQTLPVESRLESDGGVFSLASINGESEPRQFRAGERVPAGAVNVSRSAVAVVSLQPWSESVFAELVRASDGGEPRHAWLEKIVRGYVWGILAVAAGAGVGWWLGSHDGLRAGAVVTAVLVVSCPCAIGLAFPLADEMAAVGLRRSGIFVREAGLWAKLARVRQVVFDKTGTLTLEMPLLLNPSALIDLNATERAALLALVRDNPHPIAECLRAEILARGNDTALVGHVVEDVGHGVEIGPWSLGRPGWKTAALPDGPDRLGGGDAADGAERRWGGDAVFARLGAVVAVFHFADRPRPDASREVAELRRRGLAVAILSGDRPEKVDALAAEVGIPAECAIAGATPRAKADWLLDHRANETLLLGDGANDSLAFDRALCRGTPAIHRGILERKADFYYLGRGIGGIRVLLDADLIRRRTHRTILVFSIVYNVLAVGLAVVGRMNPLIAAVLMPANSLVTLAIVTVQMRPVLR